MKVKIGLFLFSFLIWMTLGWTFDLEHLAMGVLVGVLVTALTADMFVREIETRRGPVRYLWFLLYIPLFLWECLKSNIDGAYRVIHPDVPIKPGIVKIKTSLRSDTGLTFLANSLTLKPGTMTVDIDKEKGYLYVHWSDVKSEDIEKATALIAARFESILKKVFD